MTDRSDIFQAILEQRRNNADLKDLAAGFLQKWEGVDGIMKELKLVYDSAQTATDKTKILLAGIDMVKQVAAAGGNKEDNLDDLTDDELKTVLREAVR